MELRNFFKKNNSKNSAQNDRDLENKNNKFLKVFGCLALATFMTATALFATAPFGTGAASAATNSNLSINTKATNNGLITPQEDDPVLFKTESGIEIKWGNAKNVGNLSTGALSGFPYFRTVENNIAYIWVIIGKDSNVSSGSVQHIQQQAYNDWLTGTIYDTVNEFTLNQHEIKTPAGLAIEPLLQNTYLMYEPLLHFNNLNVTTNDEIPSNCVLCVSNDILGNGAYTTSTTNTNGMNQNQYGISYRRPNNYAAMSDVLESYYTNKKYGLNVIVDHIPLISNITSKVSDTTTVTEDRHIFALAYNSTEMFCYSTYLTAEEALTSSSWWLRSTTGDKWLGTINAWAGSVLYRNCISIDTNGSPVDSVYSSSLGYRPAFCLRLI